MINQRKKIRNTALNSNRSKQTTPRTGAVGIVRIAAGKWKRTPIPVADRAGLRPTASRVRETIFDWIQFLFSSSELSYLDMFAGSGALGLEAASRGAKSVDIVELNTISAKGIKELVTKLGAHNVSIINQDAFKYVSRIEKTYDVIFIDPPYELDLQEKAVRVALKILDKEGVIYVENPQSWLSDNFLCEVGLVRVRRGSASLVKYELLVRSESTKASLKKE